MHIKRKINFKRYFFFFILWLIPCFYLANSNKEILAIFIVALGTVINQFMLVEVVSELVSDKKKINNKNRKMIMLIMAKLFVIFAALFCGGLLMGNRIIIPLIYFVLMIFSLAYSIKK